MTSDDLIDTDYGPAISFDGTDDYFNCGALSQTLSLATFFGLMKLSSAQSSYVGWVSDNQNGVRMTHEGNKYPLLYTGADTPFNSTNANWSAYAGTWATYAITFTSTESKFYINGVLVDTITYSSRSMAMTHFYWFRNTYDSSFLSADARDIVLDFSAWSADHVAAFSKNVLNTLATIARNVYLSGTVRDQSNTPISGATVKAFNASDELSYSTLTTSSGAWTIDYILDGTYDIVAEYSGYQSDIVNGVTPEEA